MAVPFKESSVLGPWGVVESLGRVKGTFAGEPRTLCQIFRVRTVYVCSERLACLQRHIPHCMYGLNPDPGINECLLAECECESVSQSKTALLWDATYSRMFPRDYA